MPDALERVTNLLALLLETRVPLTLERIVTELVGQYPAGEAARRGAFERDKAMLREIGVPIESVVLAGNDAGKSAYRIDRRRYELADLELESDERAALEFAVAAARLADGEFGLLKLGGDRGRSAVVANIPELTDLPVLREAVAQRAEVAFGYHGSPRRLWPYALLLREGFWYVIGHDVGRDAVRTYRVDRIEGTVSVGAPQGFERPPGFDPRTVFPADARALGDEPEARARVAVWPPSAREAAEGGEVVEWRPDESVVVEVPCANRDAFRSWVFGWEADAEVLGPAEVRADVVRWLRAMAASS